jgi:hypothetical protein
MASPSTTVIKYGDELLVPVAQSGWTVEADGFGLLQAQVKFKWDISKRKDFPATFVKGTKLSVFIDGVEDAYKNLELWKANMVTDKSNVLVITGDFCGIDPLINEGLRTNPQVVATSASAAEPIEHHPNFLVNNCTSGTLETSTVLAGFPPASGWEEDPSVNPNRALWTPKVLSNGAIQAQQFVGFLPNQKASEYAAGHVNIKAGIKNYYKPQLNLRVLQYLTTKLDALNMASYVGWVNDGSFVNLPQEYKDFADPDIYLGTFVYTVKWKAKINQGFLMTSCSVEVFGGIYKVTTDLMLSGLSGWDKDIYPAIKD